MKVTLDGDRDTHNECGRCAGARARSTGSSKTSGKLPEKCALPSDGNFDADSVESFPALLDFLKEQDFSDKLVKVAFKPIIREKQVPKASSRSRWSPTSHWPARA